MKYWHTIKILIAQEQESAFIPVAKSDRWGLGVQIFSISRYTLVSLVTDTIFSFINFQIRSTDTHRLSAPMTIN